MTAVTILCGLFVGKLLEKKPFHIGCFFIKTPVLLSIPKPYHNILHTLYSHSTCYH